MNAKEKTKTSNPEPSAKAEEALARKFETTQESTKKEGDKIKVAHPEAKNRR